MRDGLRARWDRWYPRWRDEHPSAAYTELLAMLALAAVLVTGTVVTAIALKVEREIAPVGTLLQGESLVRYEHLQSELAQKPRPALKRKALVHRNNVLVGRMRAIIRDAGLRGCEDSFVFTGSTDGPVEEFTPECWGYRPMVRGLVWLFVVGGFVSIMLLGFWLSLQYQDLWMLPRWSRHLWFTPAYVVVIAAVTVTLPLGVAGVFGRFRADYPLPVGGTWFDRQSWLLWWLVVLQAADLIVLGFRRVRPVYDRPELVASLVVAMAAASCLALNSVLALVVGVGAFVGLAWWSAGAPEQPTWRDVLPQSGPALAWVFWVLYEGLPVVGIHVAALRYVTLTACVTAAVSHLLRSREREAGRAAYARA
jgi:hypothetical protein